MRILHVTHQYRPAVGGAERHITNQSQELARRGHQVDVFTTRSTDYRTWRGSLPLVENLDGVNVYRFDCIERGPRTWRILDRGLRGYWRTHSARYMPLIVWGNGPISPSLIWRLLRYGRQYDLIHVNSLHYAPVTYVYWTSRLLEVAFALTPFVHIDQAGVFDIGFQNAIMRKSDLVLAMTTSEKEYLVERSVAPHRVTVVGSGIDLDDYPRQDPGACRQRLNLPRDAFVLLFLGRKVEYKGLGTLLAACAELRSQCPNLVLVAAGAETDYSRQLRRRYAGLQHVIFYDTVPEQLKLDLLNACDVLAMPSVGESFGIVYVEAWAVGRAVIGARSGAVSSLICDGVDGLLAAPGDVHDTAAKIALLCHDSKLRKRLATAGHLKAKTRYTVQKVADATEGAYLRTIRQRKNALCRHRQSA